MKFLYLLSRCAASFAGLFHAWIGADFDLPLIGASGAVAGVIAAYLMLHPRVRVWVWPSSSSLCASRPGSCSASGSSCRS